jgi:putative acetyltransferase
MHDLLGEVIDPDDRRVTLAGGDRGRNAMIEIREEEPGDYAAVHEINRLAFGQGLEARIVDALRANGGALLSLVATRQGQVVGHILYSPIRVGTVVGAALGPMAVVPEAQRQGIGTELVRSGNDRLARTHCPYVVVLGHPEFYPRFGFRPASQFGVTCEWNVPDDAFMMLVLDPTQIAGAVGLAEYRPEFAMVE